MSPKPWLVGTPHSSELKASLRFKRGMWVMWVKYEIWFRHIYIYINSLYWESISILYIYMYSMYRYTIQYNIYNIYIDPSPQGGQTISWENPIDEFAAVSASKARLTTAATDSHGGSVGLLPVPWDCHSATYRPTEPRRGPSWGPWGLVDSAWFCHPQLKIGSVLGPWTFGGCSRTWKFPRFMNEHGLHNTNILLDGTMETMEGLHIIMQLRARLPSEPKQPIVHPLIPQNESTPKRKIETRLWYNRCSAGLTGFAWFHFSFNSHFLTLAKLNQAAIAVQHRHNPCIRHRFYKFHV